MYASMLLQAEEAGSWAFVGRKELLKEDSMDMEVVHLEGWDCTCYRTLLLAAVVLSVGYLDMQGSCACPRKLLAVPVEPAVAAVAFA